MAIQENGFVVEPLPVVSEGQNLIKACLFNLIVLSGDLERAIYCQELIRIITEKYPCRILFVRSDPTAQSDFLNITRTVQTVGTGNNRVLCDQIVIEVSANQFYKVPFLIIPHIVPDLPVYILLGQDPAKDHIILPHIQKLATRVIFDLETISNPTTFSEQITALVQQAKCDFVDMNWARTKAWREVISQVFNDEERCLQLIQSKLIQISYVAKPHHPKSQYETQAVYLQAWLASRLGWNLVSVEEAEGCLRISYRHDHTSLTVSLVPKDTEILDPGAIFSVEVMTQCDYHFLITHEMDNKNVKVHSSNPERCDIPYSIFLNNYQRGPALVSEIFYQAPSEHYHEMLKVLAAPEWSKCIV